MKITIVGKGRGWKDAPKEDEIWGVNELCLWRDVDLVFEIHDLEWLSTVNKTEKENLLKITEYVNKNNTPIVLQEKHPDIPTSIAFPLDEMHTDYFTNSISLMIAYAIYKGATQIDLYGCVLWRGSGYTFEKPNIEYWIGYARGLGVKVNIHGVSNLLKSNNGLVYGFLTEQRR